MTRNEIIDLLDILSASYPYAAKSIANPKALIAAWEMTLGEFSAEAVYKAARLHLETNKYFPSPSDIRDKIVRSQIVYQPTITNAIEATSSKDEAEIEKNLDLFCKWIGFGCEPDDTVELPKGFLPYEM